MSTSPAVSWLFAAVFFIGCSPPSEADPVVVDIGSRSDTGIVSDLGADADADEATPLVPVTPPVFPENTQFIDAHMHCGALDPSDDAKCAIGDVWQQGASAGAAGVILSIEHWTMSLTQEDLEQLAMGLEGIPNPDDYNELYAATAASRDELAFFISLDCWHDTPFGDNWADACKEDARRWVTNGTVGFKDHVGKQWQSDANGPRVADSGIFAGAWSRNAGRCADASGEAPNRDCVKSEEVLYPLLTEEWREVVRYIVEELEAPIVTHATTWYGAEAECWDPLTETVMQCAPMSRTHLLEFVDWAERNITEDARRRIVVAHSGFMVPGEKLLPRESDTDEVAAERARIAQEMLTQLDQVLASGVSVESSTTADYVAMTYRQDGTLGACQLRELFAKYPDQLLFGTDRIVDNGECLGATYDLWEDLLTLGVREQGPTRGACFGAAATYGLDLDEPTIADCPGEVPADIGERFLRTNFLGLYE